MKTPEKLWIQPETVDGDILWRRHRHAMADGREEKRKTVRETVSWRHSKVTSSQLWIKLYTKNSNKHSANRTTADAELTTTKRLYWPTRRRWSVRPRRCLLCLVNYPTARRTVRDSASTADRSPPSHSSYKYTAHSTHIYHNISVSTCHGWMNTVVTQ